MATVSESERTVDPARAEIVARVRALGEKGLYLQAYQASREAGPLHELDRHRGNRAGRPPGLPVGRTDAGQLAGPPRLEGRSVGLGGPFLQCLPHLPPSRAVLGLALDRPGRRSGRQPRPANSKRGWHALRGLAAGALRDFTVGESLLDEAIRLAPDCSYAHLCRASLLEYEDRYEDALAVVREVLTSDPSYAQALEFASHLYTLLDRDQEAIETSRRGLRAFRVRLARGAAARLPDGTQAVRAGPRKPGSLGKPVAAGGKGVH